MKLLTILIMMLFYNLSSVPQLVKVNTRIKKLFLKELQRKNIQNAFLHIYAPTHDINWKFADGQFADGSPVTVKNPFLTASIGKSFTATAILILSEQNRLSIHDNIHRLLPAEIIEGLHVYRGNDYSKKITIAHLLQHTSGLPDYFEDSTRDGSENVIRLLFSKPDRQWHPVETIQFAKEKMKPHFAPGQGYHYTDTEYVLLGMIIENVTGQSLNHFFSEYFFKPLEMKHTAMHMRSESLQPVGKLAETYAGRIEISSYKSISADWAGGGLSAAAADLNKFQLALHSGNLISPKTLETMQQWVPESKGMYYGFGLRKFVFRELFPLLPKLEIIGHSGSTGSFMYYCPQLDVYLAGTLNQTEAVKRSVVWMVKILSEIKKRINLNR